MDNNLRNKVILVDDHSLLRIGVRTVIKETMPSIEVLAEYGSGQELLMHLTQNTHPDIVLLDIIMPDMSGIETASIIRATYPKIKIIILSSETDTETAEKLISIGVDGYLSKMSIQQDLVNAIKAVQRDELFYGRDVAKIMYGAYVSKTSASQMADDVNITDREKEIIELLCSGLSIKKIAEQLDLSARTVEHHKTSIMRKLGFENSVELIRYAIRAGIIGL